MIKKLTFSHGLKLQHYIAKTTITSHFFFQSLCLFGKLNETKALVIPLPHMLWPHLLWPMQVTQTSNITEYFVLQLLVSQFSFVFKTKLSIIVKLLLFKLLLFKLIDVTDQHFLQVATIKKPIIFIILRFNLFLLS